MLQSVLRTSHTLFKWYLTTILCRKAKQFVNTIQFNIGRLSRTHFLNFQAFYIAFCWLRRKDIKIETIKYDTEGKMHFLKHALRETLSIFNVHNNKVIKESSLRSLSYKEPKTHRGSIIYLRPKSKYVAGLFFKTIYVFFNPDSLHLFATKGHHFTAIFEDANDIYVALMYYLFIYLLFCFHLLDWYKTGTQILFWFYFFVISSI